MKDHCISGGGGAWRKGSITRNTTGLWMKYLPSRSQHACLYGPKRKLLKVEVQHLHSFWCTVGSGWAWAWVSPGEVQWSFLSSSLDEHCKITAIFEMHLLTYYDHEMAIGSRGMQWSFLLGVGIGSDLTIFVKYGKMERSLHLAMAQKS